MRPADSGDGVLRKHLATAAFNAMHTSNTIQNAIIQSIDEETDRGILLKIELCGPYGMLLDETTGLSCTNVMSFVAR